MKIAIEGCAHGELDKIYETLAYIEQKHGYKIDLLLICGDFQAVRNRGDLQSMAVPQKYKRMNAFYKYYSGEKKAPMLTVFIGGNHEASNYMQELPYGGWVAKNIYYLGYAGVVQFGGIRIAGLSGIYKARDFLKGHFEYPPYNEETKRSVYHIRNLEAFRLKQITRPIDIFLSHDWPQGIHQFGNCKELLCLKKYLKNDIENNSLGSPPAKELLYKLKPHHWFAAHLHVKFAAIVKHNSINGESKETKFLSLDRCLQKRKFLQILDIAHDTKKPLRLQLDPEWLSILSNTNHLLHLEKSYCYMPGPNGKERWNFAVSDEDLEKIKMDFGDDTTVPENFEQTGEVHYVQNTSNKTVSNICINPQTSLLCTMLDLTNPNEVFLKGNLKCSFENSPSFNTSASPETPILDETDTIHDVTMDLQAPCSPLSSSSSDESKGKATEQEDGSKRQESPVHQKEAPAKKLKRRNIGIYSDSQDSEEC